MFNYGLKFRIILFLFFVVIFFVAIILVRGHNAKANDLNTVYQAQKVAEGLEKYYSKFNAYPDIAKIDVSNIKIISDQGLNNRGDIVFFQDRLDWDRSVSLKSQGDFYSLEFTLTEKWSVWGIDSREGAVCSISNGIRMNCQNKPATFLDYFR